MSWDFRSVNIRRSEKEKMYVFRVELEERSRLVNMICKWQCSSLRPRVRALRQPSGPQGRTPAVYTVIFWPEEVGDSLELFGVGQPFVRRKLACAKLTPRSNRPQSRLRLPVVHLRLNGVRGNHGVCVLQLPSLVANAQDVDESTED